jgi:peroxiredoxin
VTDNLKPGERFPVEQFQLVERGNAGLQSLIGQSKGLLLLAYRGAQCGYCKSQLSEVEVEFSELASRNFTALALSTDTAERAAGTKRDLRLSKLAIAYGLSETDARRCGLYLSAARKDSEMPILCEPGAFIIDSDQKLQVAWLGSFAFPRPPLSEILRAIDLLATMDDSLTPRGGA